MRPRNPRLEFSAELEFSSNRLVLILIDVELFVR